VFDAAQNTFSHDTRYFITSLDPSQVTASGLQKLVRDHWQVENCLHFVKDRWWDEDRHYLARPGLGEVFAALTNFALSVLRLLQQPGDSLVKTAENLRYAPRKILHILGIHSL
jgi:predicted transposase YbfD/YdcC